MGAAELVERLTNLIQEQADIIRELADALSQLGAAAELDEKMMAAELERAAALCLSDKYIKEVP